MQFYAGNFLDGKLIGQGRTVVRTPQRILPGDAALSGYAEPAEFSNDAAEARTGYKSRTVFTFGVR